MFPIRKQDGTGPELSSLNMYLKNVFHPLPTRTGLDEEEKIKNGLGTPLQMSILPELTTKEVKDMIKRN